MDKNKVKTSLKKMSKFIIPMRNLQKKILDDLSLGVQIKYNKVLKLQKYNRRFLKLANGLNLRLNEPLKKALLANWKVNIDKIFENKDSLDLWIENANKSIYREMVEKIDKVNNKWSSNTNNNNNTETPTRISWGPPTSRYSERYPEDGESGGQEKYLWYDFIKNRSRGNIKSEKPSILKKKGGRKYRKKRTKKRRKSRRRMRRKRKGKTRRKRRR